MFSRRTLPVLIALVSLSGMFLLGQETWPPPACVDYDGDGYGNPASAACTYPELDCDDSNADVNPGVTEASHGEPMCGDGLDNDCDGLTDLEDNGCQECISAAECDDANPCTDDDCVNYACVYESNTNPCDDGDACTMEDTCSGGVCTGVGLDADGDGYVSDACGGDDCDDSNADVYPGAPELCDGIDNQCPGNTGYGEVDEGCGPVESLLPDTGIMTCYNNTVAIECPAPGQPFYGQDAQYTTNPMSYTVNGDRTVTDNVTGLMWQSEDGNVTRTWTNAIAYCENLTLAGYSDWRLPDEYELQSIVDYGRYNPAIDTAAFPGTKSTYYWSSSPGAYGTGSAWAVVFSDGDVYYSNKTNTHYVRCVR